MRNITEHKITEAVIGQLARFVHHASGTPPFGPVTVSGFYALDYDFLLKPAARARRERP